LAHRRLGLPEKISQFSSRTLLPSKRKYPPKEVRESSISFPKATLGKSVRCDHLRCRSVPLQGRPDLMNFVPRHYSFQIRLASGCSTTRPFVLHVCYENCRFCQLVHEIFVIGKQHTGRRPPPLNPSQSPVPNFQTFATLIHCFSDGPSTRLVWPFHPRSLCPRWLRPLQLGRRQKRRKIPRHLHRSFPQSPRQTLAKGKALNWYAKPGPPPTADEAHTARLEELRRVKESEEEPLAEALGLKLRGRVLWERARG
jgi:hypothetical protein